jgi:porin
VTGRLPPALLLTLLLAPLARADDWWTRPTLLGDSGGLRSSLAARGIAIDASTVVEAMGNPVGGRRQGLTAVTSTGIDLAFDLERLASLPGLTFYLSGAWRTGKSLSQDYIGNAFPVQEEWGNETIRLYQLALEQSLWDDRLNVMAGRIAPGDDFATSDLVCLFVSNGICGNPIAIPIDDPSFATYPVSTWGLRVRGRPWANVYAQAGVYEANAALALNDTHGLDFDVLGRSGVLLLGEGGWRRPDDQPRGRAAVGLWWDSNTFDDLGPGARGRPARQHAGNQGFYVIGEHALWPGVDAFTMATFAPDDRNPLPFFWDAGVTWRGLVPGRDADVLVFGGMYGAFSDALQDRQRLRHAQGRRRDPPQTWEAVIELGYWIQVTGWLQIQPDLQWVVRPGGTGAIDDALALGAQVVVTY